MKFFPQPSDEEMIELVNLFCDFILKNHIPPLPAVIAMAACVRAISDQCKIDVVYDGTDFKIFRRDGPNPGGVV